MPLPTTQSTLFSHAAQSDFPEVVPGERRGPVLHPTPYTSSEDVLGLNLMRGCVHRCSFCSVRAHAPLGAPVELYTNTRELLAEELRARPPRAVLLCPGTDPFPPIPEVQEEVLAIVRLLSAHGVQSRLMTRGLIRPAILEALTEHREHLKVIVGLTTVDEKWHRALEPGTAPPQARVEQIERLQEVGVAVQVAVDPLVPHLTDTRDNLEGLVETLGILDLKEVTVSYMFLRGGIADHLRLTLGDAQAEVVVGAFRRGPLLEAPGLATARYLPKAHRQRGYALLKTLAARHGIGVTINRVTNPDFGPQGGRRARTTRPSLLTMFKERFPTE